ncbi:tetratricopeptide repeat protein [Patescibacteria group bacterium]|jgi:O-antigen ligase/tetratricopeptide (TPR) repeat protein|nr:tetratricopeptide repeat protein [Patescibacteria group bacterium]
MQLSNTLRILVLAGIYALPFIVLYVAGSMFFPFITGKNFVFRILIEVVFVAWVLLALLDPRYRPKLSYIWIALSILVGSLLISTLLSPNTFKSFWSNFERMEGWITFAHLWMYFTAAAAVLQSEKHWQTFFNITLGVAGYLGITALFQIVPAMLAGERIGRLDLTFGNPTYLAIYSVVHIFLALVLLQKHWGVLWLRVLYLAIALLQLPMLFYTGTRGSILGFLGGMLATGVVLALVQRGNPLMRKIAVGAIAGVLAIVGTFFLARDTAFVQESPVLGRFANIDLSGDTVASRFMIWQMAWQGFQERPIFGWGPESFNFVFNEHYVPQMYGNEPWFDRTHNVVMDYLISGGIIGFLSYLALAGAVLYYLWIWRRGSEPLSFWERLEDHPMNLTERSLLTGLLAAYLFHNLFVFDNLTSYILYIALLAYVHVRVTAEREPLGKSLTVNRDTVTFVVAPVLAVVLVVFIYQANIRGMATAANLVEGLRTLSAARQVQAPEQKSALYTRALDLYDRALEDDLIGNQEVREQYVQAASRVAGSDASQELKQLFTQKAEEAMRVQIERVPNDARTQLFMGSYLANLGRFEEAIEYLERGVELSPGKQSTYVEIAMRYINLGQPKRALEYFRQAFELDPSILDMREYYALGLIYDGQYEEADALFLTEAGELDRDIIPQKRREEFALASGTDDVIIDDDRFLRAWQGAGQHDRVVAILRKRVAENPDNAQSHVSLAAGLVAAGNPEAAIEAVEQAIAIDPSFEAQGQQFIEQIRAGELTGQ